VAASDSGIVLVAGAVPRLVVVVGRPVVGVAVVAVCVIGRLFVCAHGADTGERNDEHCAEYE
jgi:hypothetical protein